ncbi:hypothetical protein [Salinibacterium sp. ZJ454]|uniref:hypothetical protein n=1 Tax=Salinibacterium sp. ZJ454 TaxID=2708339 RepID=UPI0014233627|nr:hypothetical protein [Salinibacterium sp. ZJ454]
MFRSRARSAPHGTDVPRGRRASRKAIAVALAAFLVLAGPGAAWALWTATTSTSSTAAAARVGVTQQVTALDTVYPAGYSGTTAITGSITVRNTGSVPGIASLTPSTQGGLASAVSVKVWQGNCAVMPDGLTGTTWASLPTLTTPIGPDESTVWCVQTALDSFTALQYWGQSASVSFAAALTATGTGWTATAPTVGVTQSAGTAHAGDPQPTPPQLTVCTTHNNGQRLDLAWPHLSGFTSYSVKVNGPTPSITTMIEFPTVTSPIELTKQQLDNSGAPAGTYVITVYAGTTAIATDKFTIAPDGNKGLACVR